MKNKKLLIVFTWPRSGTHLLWSKIVENTNYVLGHNFPVIPLLWQAHQKKIAPNFIPYLPNPWKEETDFNISQNYAFFVNSSVNWRDKSEFFKSKELIKIIANEVGFNNSVNLNNIDLLYKKLIMQSLGENLLIINRFPYNNHYQPNKITKYISEEWNIDDGIKSTNLLLSLNEKTNVSYKVICIFPTFKEFFFKRNSMFKNGFQFAVTDYLSLTHFINYFYKDKRFNFVRSSDAINICLNKSDKNIIDRILNRSIDGKEARRLVLSNFNFQDNINKTYFLHKYRRIIDWVSDDNQFTRAPLSHSLSKAFIKSTKLHKKTRLKFLSDLSFSFADKGGLINNF